MVNNPELINKFINNINKLDDEIIKEAIQEVESEDMEEDIKILEEMLKDEEQIIKYHCWIGTKSIQAIKNLLKRYKELEEENKKLKESETYLYDAYQDAGKKMFEYAEELEKSIPISVIQNKIDELRPIVDSYEKQTENDEETYLCYEEVREYACKIETLQELLEERNK